MAHKPKYAKQEPRRNTALKLLPLVLVVALLIMEPHMSGIVLTTAMVGTILLLSGSGGVLGLGCTFFRRCPFRGGSARLIRRRWKQPLRSGCPTAQRSPRRWLPAFHPRRRAAPHTG